jgi:hypothetical protein
MTGSLPDLFRDGKVYTSGEVGRILGFRNYSVIWEWTSKGWLKEGFRTPGGDHRYHGRDLNEFVRNHPNVRPQP